MTPGTTLYQSHMGQHLFSEALLSLPAPEGYYLLVTKSNSNFLPISMSPTLTNSNLLLK